MISFAYTTPAFLARRKTVTRRDWDDDYARSFMVGRVFSAFDKQPRFGGVRIGRARVVAIDKQPLVQMPDSDYEAEGFAYDRVHFSRVSTSQR